MNMQEITSVLSDLHRISGFRVSLHDTEFNEIAAFPEEHLPFCSAVNKIESEHDLCMMCDKSACMQALEKRDTYIYRCRYGLIEAVSPLYNFGTLTGFLMMGQTVSSPDDLSGARQMLADSNDSESFISAISKIPITNSELVESYVRIMTVCASR